MKSSGTRIPGPHMVMARLGLKLRSQTDRIGQLCGTLTQARKLAKVGDAIVRVADRTVVAVK